MKRILIGIALGILGLLGIGYGQPAAPPPDVYLQWVMVGGALTNAATQSIIIPLPQNNISRYSFHYIYIFISPPCTPSYVNQPTTGILLGSVPISGTANRLIPIGGLISNNIPYAKAGTGGPILLIKGNGAVNALSAVLNLVAVGSSDFSPCTMDVLYKGTVNEEEGTNPFGVYTPSRIEIDNASVTPTVTTSGPLTNYLYTLNPPGSTTLTRAAFAIDNVYLCVNPNGSGVFPNTTPVRVQLILQGSTQFFLGMYPILNSCINVNSPGGNLGVIPQSGVLQVNFSFPVAASYATTGGDLMATVFGHVVH